MDDFIFINASTLININIYGQLKHDSEVCCARSQDSTKRKVKKLCNTDFGLNGDTKAKRRTGNSLRSYYQFFIKLTLLRIEFLKSINARRVREDIA